MAEKRPIDRVRESAGFMEVGAAGDPVMDIFAIGDHLHAVKGLSIHEIKLADDIDPQRTNIDVPNTQQKVLDYGSESPLVGRILLTAKELFNPSYLPKEINCKECLRVTFEALKDVAAMTDIWEAFQQEEKSALQIAEDRRNKDRSFVLPAIENLHARVKDFIQKTDHTLVSLFSIVKLFYPDCGQGGFEGFADVVQKRYGKEDEFAGFLSANSSFLKFIRRARNAIEHPRKNQMLVTTNFAFSPNGTVTAPTIEVIVPQTPMRPTPLHAFIPETIERIVTAIELIVVCMCDKHAQGVGGIEIHVFEFPEGTRAHKHVRYGYGIYDGERLIRAS